MPRVIVLFIAISEALAARTDLLCYFAMIINTLMSASILSIVYPLSVFFWGMLSVPRPTKFYWVATITYTEVWLIFVKYVLTFETFQCLTVFLLQFIIVLKYLFQFNFFPWNKGVPGKFTWPQIVGIEKKEMYAALDFFVLFCLFIHRMMLKVIWIYSKYLSAFADSLTNICNAMTHALVRNVVCGLKVRRMKRRPSMLSQASPMRTSTWTPWCRFVVEGTFTLEEFDCSYLCFARM